MDPQGPAAKVDARDEVAAQHRKAEGAKSVDELVRVQNEVAAAQPAEAGVLRARAQRTDEGCRRRVGQNVDQGVEGRELQEQETHCLTEGNEG